MQSSQRYCTGSNIYELGLCAVSELRRQYYHEEYPLYYVLGFTHVAIKAVPGTYAGLSRKTLPSILIVCFFFNEQLIWFQIEKTPFDTSFSIVAFSG